MAIPIFSQKSNRWREYYNPLRGLSLPKLVSLLESGDPSSPPSGLRRGKARGGAR